MFGLTLLYLFGKSFESYSSEIRCRTLEIHFIPKSPGSRRYNLKRVSIKVKQPDVELGRTTKDAPRTVRKQPELLNGEIVYANRQ